MMKNSSNKKKVNPILHKTWSVLLLAGRFLLGAVFVFSGFVKAIDPLGFTYKIEDYLHAFGGVFDSFAAIAFPAAIALSTLELLIGLNFIFKIQLKRTAIFTLLFLLVMIPLTLHIALKNPVTNCGCFGEALVISNWTTFYKNLLLAGITVVVLIFNKNFRVLFLPRVEWMVVGVFMFFGIALSIYSYRHLPIIDFLPYKIGVNIPEAMVIPKNALSDEYSTTFIYQKNGQQKEFTLQNYPKGDSTWVFVDQKSVLITKGYVPPIHDFTVVNAQFDDITEKVLYNPGYTYLLTMYDLAQTSAEGAKKAEMLYQKVLKLGIDFYALTASSDAEVKRFKQKTGVTFPFCKTDPITLKTIIRANPGLVLIKKGTIVGKWNWRDF